MEVCAIGKHLFPEEEAPCPAIIYEDGIVRCGVVLAEKEMGKDLRIAEALGIGMGCCATDLEERE